MPPARTIANEYLEALGFSKEEITLYLTLVKNGPSTLLEASRLTNIERTKLYRIIDTLADRGLLEQVPEYKRRTIKAADINTIELLVKEREREDTFLKHSFSEFADTLQSMATTTFPGNNVVYYRGKEGMRQMTWHILRCKGLFRTYSYSFWDDYLGGAFVSKLNNELNARNFKVHDLYSDEYIEFKKNWFASGKGKPVGSWGFWDSRYISEKIVKVHLNIDVYNDVVSYYYWHEEEIFGVEIYNERVATIQKQIHDVLWGMAEKRPDINWTKKGLE